MANWLRKDPTRTTLLRRRFVADMTRRFKKVNRAIQKLVVQEDVFGLIDKQPLMLQSITTLQGRQAWRFLSDGKKVTSYRKWLQEQVDAAILTPVDGISGKPWTATYVESAYRKGSVRAYTDLHAEDLAQSPDFYAGGKAQFLRTAFSSPMALQKIELLYTRAFEELKGITQAMGQQMSRTLANGLVQGYGPFKIARELRKIGTTINKTRANTLARTEVISAHAEGQLDSFERLGIKEVGVMAEWSTAGDDVVCPECGELEGVVMTIQEARGLLPRHPNCRCSWIPANRQVKEAGQKRGREKDDAIARSVRAEGGISRKTGQFRKSLSQTKSRSVWAGKEKVKDVSVRPTSRPITAPKVVSEPRVEYAHELFNESSPNWRQEFKEAIESGKITSKWQAPGVWTEEQKAHYLLLRDKYFNKINATVSRYRTQALWERTITLKEEAAMSFYQASFENVHAIKFLQSGRKPLVNVSSKVMEEAKKHLPNLEKVISRCPAFKGKVYRGMRLDMEDALDNFMCRDVVTFDTFASCSGKKTKSLEFLEEFVADVFNSGKVPVMLEMKAASVARLGKASKAMQSWDEVLVSKDSSFRVVKVYESYSNILREDVLNIVMEQVR